METTSSTDQSADPATARSPRWRTEAAVRVVLAAVVVGFTSFVVRGEMAALGRTGDEKHHLIQIGIFCSGATEVHGRLTTIPGYHAVAALVGRTVGDCSLGVARDLNTVLGLVSVAVFFLIARQTGAGLPVARTLQYYLLPILLPYHFLAYTDVLSLLMELVSLLLLTRRRYLAAGWVGGVSLLVRQNNVAWLGFVCLYVLVEDRLWEGWREKLRGYLGKVWPCLLGMGAFGAFVAINGAVVLHERGNHRVGFHTGNVFFALFVFGVIFLPSAVAAVWRHRGRLADPWLGAVLAVGYVVFVTSFQLEHPYNRFDGFLRNDLLRLVDREPLVKLAMFVPIGLAVSALYLARPRRPAYYAVFPLALVLLVPAWVIETRYYFVPFVLMLAFREDESPFVEAAGVGYSAVLSTYVLYGVSGGRFGV